MSEESPSVRRGMVPALIVLSLSVVYLPWAYSYDPEGRAVPVLVGWLTVGLAALDIMTQTNTPFGRYLFQLLSGRAMDAGLKEPGAEYTFGRQFVAVLWLIGFVGAVTLVGFLITVPIYVLVFMKFQGRKSLRQSIIAAVVITAVVWVMFEGLLRYEVYPGILFEG